MPTIPAARKQRLTTAWADGDIDKESYEEAKKSTEQEIQEQEKIYNMYLETGTNILETMDNIEKIFENPLFFLKSSQIEVRSAFLRLIFANCYVDNKKARFSLKKSLSLFVKNRDFELWRDILCNSRTDFLHELLLFGKDVKIFLKTWKHYTLIDIVNI